jgi:hypothetical protein
VIEIPQRRLGLLHLGMIPSVGGWKQSRRTACLKTNAAPYGPGVRRDDESR